MTNWKEQIETAAYDLTNMEINTIISSDMTAAKAPSRPRELLHKLASKYDEKLNDLINVYNLESELKEGKNLSPDEISKIDIQLNGEIKRSGYYSFKEMYNRAVYIEKCIQNAAAFVDRTNDEFDHDLAMINRIQRNCQEIKDLLYQTDTFIFKDDRSYLHNRKSDPLGNFDISEEEIKKVTPILTAKKNFSLGDLSIGLSLSRDSKTKNNRDKKYLDLDLRQLTLLKKAFDIGTSKVVLQTIIGLDGDVTTRVAKSFADNQIPLVNELHHDGIRLSVNYWQNLIDALTKFGEYIISLFAKK